MPLVGSSGCFLLTDVFRVGINKAHAQAEVPIEHLRVSQAMVNLAGRLKRMKAMGRGNSHRAYLLHGSAVWGSIFSVARVRALPCSDNWCLFW